MLDVIGYFVSQLAMLDINSLAGGSNYSQPCVAPFLPHEEELYNKLVSILLVSTIQAHCFLSQPANSFVVSLVVSRIDPVYVCVSVCLSVSVCLFVCDLTIH